MVSIFVSYYFDHFIGNFTDCQRTFSIFQQFGDIIFFPFTVHRTQIKNFQLGDLHKAAATKIQLS